MTQQETDELRVQVAEDLGHARPDALVVCEAWSGPYRVVVRARRSMSPPRTVYLEFFSRLEWLAWRTQGYPNLE